MERLKIDCNKFYIRKLMSNGKCSHCEKEIKRNDENCLTFINNKDRYAQVVLCENCTSKLIQFLYDNTLF